MNRSRKKILWTLGVVVAVLVGSGCYLLWEAAYIGAGFKAKLLCSGVFVSQRDPESVLREDLALTSLRSINTEVDYDTRSVTASALFGLLKRRCVFRDGLGCTLLAGTSDEQLRSQHTGDLTPLPPNQQDLPWPTGDLMPIENPPPSVDAQKLAEALDRAFSEPDPEQLRRTRAVVVVYEGRIIAERYAPGFTQDTRLLGWSMTKSVLNALVGILIAQGKLSIDAPAPVPEWDRPGDPRKAITLDQLLRMSSGLAWKEEMVNLTAMLFGRGSADVAAYAANRPLVAEPDSTWYYSSGTANIIARTVRDAVGGTQADYFAFPRRTLFGRIGMRSAVMEPDASGTFVGSSYMYATARDWARFGLLYLQDGVWEGERILPEGWVTYSRTPTPPAPRGEYGALFWTAPPRALNDEGRNRALPPPDAYSAEGFEGQSVTIVPSRKLVVVRLGLSRPEGVWNSAPFVADIIKALPE